MSNSSVSKSPERNTFQKEGAIKRAEEAGEEVSPAYLEMWETEEEMTLKREADPAWQKDNLEWDLRTTDWILEKARTRDDYAQNIYAALCNMRWQKKELFPILGEQFWSCSWRHAGGIVADMLQKGDYIDWYCSGMGGMSGYDKDSETFEQWQERTKYVSEGRVTDEIREDFGKIGWIPSEWPEDKA